MCGHPDHPVTGPGDVGVHVLPHDALVDEAVALRLEALFGELVGEHVDGADRVIVVNVAALDGAAADGCATAELRD